MSNGDDLEKARHKAIENDQAFSRARLKRELRMKPGPDSQPIMSVRNTFGTYCDIYRVADCVPMKARPKKKAPLTEKQRENQRQFALNAYLNSKSGRAGKRAARLIEAAPVFLDTETTGLDHGDEIVEIAVVDAEGRTLLDERIRPSVPISPGAQTIHGITMESLADAPQWPDIAGKVRAVLEGKQVVIFNADFDLGLVQQTIEAFIPTRTPSAEYDEAVCWLHGLNVTCAMKMAARYYGATNRYGSISLVDAAWRAGIEFQGRAHSAAGDAATTAALWRAMDAIKQRT